MQSKDNIIGGQLNSWGDFVENKDYYESGAVGRADGLRSVAIRLPYIAENTWNVDKRKSYDEVKEAVDQQGLIGAITGGLTATAGGINAEIM